MQVKRHAFAPIIALHPIVIEMPAARKTVESVTPIDRTRRSFLMAREGEPVARLKPRVSDVIGDKSPAPTIYS